MKSSAFSTPWNFLGIRSVAPSYISFIYKLRTCGPFLKATLWMQICPDWMPEKMKVNIISEIDRLVMLAAMVNYYGGWFMPCIGTPTRRVNDMTPRRNWHCYWHWHNIRCFLFHSLELLRGCRPGRPHMMGLQQSSLDVVNAWTSWYRHSGSVFLRCVSYIKNKE